MKNLGLFVVAVLAISVANEGRAAADGTGTTTGAPGDRAAEAPSIAWPALGAILAGGGLYLTYDTGQRWADGEVGCVDLGGGCFWTGVGAGYLQLVGGALGAFYGWRVGEHRAWRDRQEGLPARNTRALRITSLIVAGAAVATNVALNQYAFWKTISCEAATAQAATECLKGNIETLTLIAVGAGVVLLITAPIVGYAFAYDGYQRNETTAQLVPTLIRGGGGLALVGRF